MSELVLQRKLFRDSNVGSFRQRKAVLPDFRPVSQVATLQDSRFLRSVQMKATVQVNDDKSLEKEADVMGGQALRVGQANILSLSDAVIQSVAIVPESAPVDADHHGDVVQRAKVWESFDSYRGAVAPNQINIQAYFNRYEIPHMVGLVDQYSTDDRKIGKVDRAYALYQQRFNAIAGNAMADWNAVAGILRGLVTHINEALNGAAHVPTGYEANDVGNWANVGVGVLAVHGAVNAGVQGVAPQSHSADARRISTINYSTAVGVFPGTLVRLLRDIHAAWKTGQVMDQRSQQDQQNGVLNADNPGALRSWHMNTSATLPAASANATPAHAAGLEAHYTATSGVMNMLGVQAPAGPIGFAEYTGTGILNDAHNSKIILDYKRGDVYLTLTHYQHWSNAGLAGFQTQGQAPSAAGTHSPWFKIDMNA